jgi:hypothetical protein
VEGLTKLMDLRERGMLAVRPNDYCEAWQLHGPRNLAVVCSPGGDYVAVFEPDPQE